MAVTSLEVPFRADPVRWWRWHGWPPVPLPLVMGLLLAGVLAGASMRLDYVYTFQPFGFGGGYIGPATRGTVKTATDGLADTTYVLVGQPGSIGTVQYPIGNTSDEDIVVLGLGGPSLITSLGWSSSLDQTPRAFPMTLKAHQEMTLRVTVTKPSYCGSGRWDSIIGVPIRFRALGVEHTYLLPLTPGGLGNDEDIPIALCTPDYKSINTR